MVTRTRDEVSCALRAGSEKGQYNTLGESGRVAGGRIEALYFFSPPACGTRGAVRGGPGPRRRARRAAAVAHAHTPVSCDRMGSVSGDRVGHFCGDRMGSVSGDRVGRLICYTETRNTRGNLFILTNITNTIIAITADSENGHDDAGRGELCVER
jgi:hypothetical protein